MGALDVPADRYWGAQTERSLHHFDIGGDRMPKSVYHAYGYVKKACALVNATAGRLPDWKRDAIVRAADETIAGKLDEHYPLFVWQTGSGTQSNMNVNEVISNRAIQLLGGTLGSQRPVGPNDDVNMGQSSNDSFPTAMHIASVEALDALLPQVESLAATIERKADGWIDVVKIGRTHLEDAVPLTVGQEWHGWAGQIEPPSPTLRRAAAASTNSRSVERPSAPGSMRQAASPRMSRRRSHSSPASRSSRHRTNSPHRDRLIRWCARHAALRGLAVALMKIANDMRWLASGPRCGLSELVLPSNEPGSSIMPGKVNPTQCEAIVMIAIQVMGNDTAVAFAGSQGNFELNAMRPVIINNFLHSARILADGCAKFRAFSVEGTELNRKQIEAYVEGSVMLVTALSPVIGYQNAAHIAEKAIAEGTTLRAAALSSGLVDLALFDRTIKPIDMVGHGLAGA